MTRITKSLGRDAADESAWSRFERAVDAAVKGGPKHKIAPPPSGNKARPASKGRVHKGKTKA
ncbi:Hypothetical protein BN69_1425 [Methylocystis sp. SC2]|nr:Hypothetical protein BN69_1425 [Methylocystis sp. SC2]